MLGKIISQLYRIADLLKDKKLVDKDSNTDNNNDSSEDKPKEITLDDIYQYTKNELINFMDFDESFIQTLPKTFDDIELIESSNVSESGIYKCTTDIAYDGRILFLCMTDNEDRYYVSYLEHKSPAA